VDGLIGRLNLWNWRTTATAAVVSIGSLLLYWPGLPPETPLLYSRPWGQDQLVSPMQLWILPAMTVGVGTVVGLLNKKMAGEGVLRAILITSSIVVQIIIVSGLLRIILLVS
jgi:hypothetical protein